MTKKQNNHVNVSSTKEVDLWYYLVHPMNFHHSKPTKAHYDARNLMMQISPNGGASYNTHFYSLQHPELFSQKKITGAFQF